MTIDDNVPYTLFTVPATLNSIGLDPQRTYTLFHTGQDAAEAGDTNLVRLAFDRSKNQSLDFPSIAAAGVGSGRANLASGQSITVAGIRMLQVIAAGGAPVLMIKSGRTEGELKK